MKRIYKYENAVIHVQSASTYNRENLKKATEEFLKKIINGGTGNVNSNSSKNIREK